MFATESKLVTVVAAARPPPIIVRWLTSAVLPGLAPKCQWSQSRPNGSVRRDTDGRHITTAFSKVMVAHIVQGLRVKLGPIMRHWLTSVASSGLGRKFPIQPSGHGGSVRRTIAGMRSTAQFGKVVVAHIVPGLRAKLRPITRHWPASVASSGLGRKFQIRKQRHGGSVHLDTGGRLDTGIFGEGADVQNVMA